MRQASVKTLTMREEGGGRVTGRRAYLHHLCRSHEPMGVALNTLHNLHYMVDYMRDIRTKILRDEI
jgi:tRNA-guanine family transglycosylase